MEPLGTTLKRTITVAAIVGLIVALSRGGIHLWPLGALMAFWYSFGGHWVEHCYLRLIRPRIGTSRTVRIMVRIGVWFIGGAILTCGIIFTSHALNGFLRASYNDCWKGGLIFIGLELVVHLASQLRGIPNFYDGKG